MKDNNSPKAFATFYSAVFIAFGIGLYLGNINAIRDGWWVYIVLGFVPFVAAILINE